MKKWYAVYNVDKAEYAAILKEGDSYNKFCISYRTRNTASAVALAEALNRGAIVCKGSITHGNSCGRCAKCKYSY